MRRSIRCRLKCFGPDTWHIRIIVLYIDTYIYAKGYFGLHMHSNAYRFKFILWSLSMTNKDNDPLAIKDRSKNYFLKISIGFCHSSNHIIKNNLAFISAGVPGPHIFDHENKLGPRSRHDRSVARVQRVCDIVHLGEAGVKMKVALETIGISPW